MLFSEIKLTIKKMPILFLMLLITQGLVLAFMFFYYGVFQNNRLELQRSYKEEGRISIEKLSEKNDSGKKIKEAFPELGEKLGSHFISAVINAQVKAEGVTVGEDKGSWRLADDNGDSFLSTGIVSVAFVNDTGYISRPSGLEEKSMKGTSFSKEMLDKGEKVCLVNSSLMSWTNDSDSIVINGDEYKVLDKFLDEPLNGILVPTEALPDKVYGADIMLSFDRPLTQSEYSNSISLIRQYFDDPGIVIIDNASVSVDQKQTFLSMMLISVLFSVLAAVIMGIIFYFLQKQREYDMAVFEIHGASANRIFWLYMSEMTVFLMISVGLGFFVFEKLLYAKNLERYGWFEAVFTFRAKLAITAVYLLISFTVVVQLVRKAVRKTPKQLITERRIG